MEYVRYLVLCKYFESTSIFWSGVHENLQIYSFIKIKAHFNVNQIFYFYNITFASNRYWYYIDILGISNCDLQFHIAYFIRAYFLYKIKLNIYSEHSSAQDIATMSNTQATVTAYLAAQKKTTNKELAAEWTLIEELHNEK